MKNVIRSKGVLDIGYRVTEWTWPFCMCVHTASYISAVYKWEHETSWHVCTPPLASNTHACGSVLCIHFSHNTCTHMSWI